MNVDKEILLESLKNLKIPFDLSFFNKPISHYEDLSEHIGFRKVEKYLTDILLYYKDDEVISEKARILLRKLNAVVLSEGKKVRNSKMCVCGYELLDDFEFCPICNAPLYKGKNCYYKNGDSSCSLDSETCKWTSYRQCGKLNG